MKLVNFKGIRDLEVSFSKNTDILANNGLGKSTIFDAFTWLLFGKDSSDRKDFEVKTLDENSVVIPKIDHEVSAIIEVNGLKVNPKRVLREKWTTKRGSSIAEFTGNETVYFWNEVPMSQSEFQAKVSGIVDEKLFKLLTNPMHFNEGLKWNDRRAVLMDMAGISGDKVNALLSQGQQDFIQSILDQGKSLEEYKKEVAAKRKNIKDELTLLPARIDEAIRNVPMEKDYTAIKQQIAAKKEAMEAVEAKLNSLVEQQRAKQREQADLEGQVYSIEAQIRRAKMDYEIENDSQLDKIEADIKRLKANIEQAESEIASLNRSISMAEMSLKTEVENKQNLLAKYNEVKAREIIVDMPSVDDKCGHCGQTLPDGMMHEAEAIAKKAYQDKVEAKQKAKADDLQSIINRGNSTKAEIERLEKQIEGYRTRIADLRSQIDGANVKIKTLTSELNSVEVANKTPFEQTDTFIELSAKVAEIKAKVAQIEVQAIDSSEKQAIQNELYDLNAQLADEGQREKSLARVEELKAQEKTMSQTLADLDGQEAQIKEVEFAKVNIMEGRVNGLFGLVKFKLFNNLINGGIEETCEAMVNGVPFGSLNNAARINAGLDIINALSAFYGASAPIFVDNAEAVTKLLPTNSQLVRLIVSEADKTLRIVNN